MTAETYYTDPSTIVADGMLTAEGRAMIRAYDAVFGDAWRKTTWAVDDFDRLHDIPDPSASAEMVAWERGEAIARLHAYRAILCCHPNYVLVCAPTVPLMEECRECFGHGEVAVGWTQSLDTPPEPTTTARCESCDGDGKVAVDCAVCDNRPSTVRGVDGDTDPLCWPCANFRQTHPGEIGIFDGDTVTT